MPSSGLIAELEVQGLKVRNAQTSFDSATIARLVRYFMERSRPELGSPLQTSPRLASEKMRAELPAVGASAAKASREFPSGVPIDGVSAKGTATGERPEARFDEQVLVPPMIRPEYEAALAQLQAAEDLFRTEESAALRHIDDINKHIQTTERKVDSATGVVLPAGTKSQ